MATIHLAAHFVSIQTNGKLKLYPTFDLTSLLTEAADKRPLT